MLRPRGREKLSWGGSAGRGLLAECKGPEGAPINSVLIARRISFQLLSLCLCDEGSAAAATLLPPRAQHKGVPLGNLCFFIFPFRKWRDADSRTPAYLF